jgi:hypothetical protein
MLRVGCLYARIARKMMKCKVQACIEANRTVSISLQDNAYIGICRQCQCDRLIYGISHNTFAPFTPQR